MVCTYIDEEVITFLDLVVKTQSSRKTDGKAASNIKIFDNLRKFMEMAILMDGKWRLVASGGLNGRL